MYVDLEYGHGASLSRGEIVRFEASSKEGWKDDGKRDETTFVIVKNDKRDYETKMKYPRQMILKTEKS